MYPRRVTNAETGCQVAAIRRAVDDSPIDSGVLQHSSDVVDDHVDAECLRRQICAGVVVTRQSHPAVLDHDDVEAVERGTPSKRSVERYRCCTRATGDDDQRSSGFATGTHVVEVELVFAAAEDRSADRTHAGQRGQLVMRTATRSVHRHCLHCAWRILSGA